MARRPLSQTPIGGLLPRLGGGLKELFSAQTGSAIRGAFRGGLLNIKTQQPIRPPSTTRPTTPGSAFAGSPEFATIQNQTTTPTLTQAATEQPPREPTTPLATPQAPLAAITGAAPGVPGVTVSAPNEQFFKVPSTEFEGEFDVFERGTNRKLVGAEPGSEFQQKGLNIDIIELGEAPGAAPTAAPTEAAPTQPVRPPLTDPNAQLAGLTQQLADIQRQRDELRQQITEVGQPSEREITLQRELADIGTATRRGIFGEEERPIQLGAVRGRQRDVLQAGVLTGETVATELEALQSTRFGALSSLQQQLGFTADDLEILKATTGVQEKIDIARRQQEIGELIQQTPGDTLVDKYSNLLSDGTILLKDVPESIQDIIFTGADDLDEVLSVKDAKELGVPFGTTKRQAFGITPEKVDELTLSQRISLTSKLANDFERNAKLARESIRQVNIIETGFNKAVSLLETGGSINAVSQAILVSFQKLLDPTSVVRESEYARSGAGLSLIGRIEGAAEKFRRGGAGVTVRDLQEFRDLGVDFMKNDSQTLLNFARRTSLQAEQAGLDLRAILTPDVLSLLEGFEDRQTGDITDEEFNTLQQEFPDLTEEEIRSLSFSQVDSDTQAAVNIPSVARLAFVNNNPGNLKFVGQAGATSGEQGFAKFNSPQAGFNALQAQIELDASRGKTLREFVFDFAPPFENDSRLYLQQMVERLGVSESTKLEDIDLNDLARKIAFKESGTKIRG